MVSAHSQQDARADGKRTILLVGRRKLYLEALAEALQSRCGLEPVVASPRRSLDPSLPAPHVVLVDGALDDDEVASLVSAMRQVYPASRALLLTSAGERDGQQRVATSGADGFVSCALQLGDLAARLTPDGGVVRWRPSPSHNGSATASAGPMLFASLTGRELSILQLLVSGDSTEEMAAALGISRHTVRTHIQNLMAKLVVSSRTEMVSLAMRSGLRPAHERTGS